MTTDERGVVDEHDRPSNIKIKTFTGRYVDPFDFHPEDVSIEDIAHHLSNICRYQGAVGTYYCPTEDQRVLTADLRWVPAGDLGVGDRLIGFDEHPVDPGQSGALRRKWRPTEVVAYVPVRRRVFRLEFDDGSTVKASAEHPWLTATKMSGNTSWVTTQSIASALSDGVKRYMPKFFDPWGAETGHEAGWLAGLLDGEGTLNLNRQGLQVAAAQNEGIVLDRLMAALDRFGFDYGVHAAGGTGRVKSAQLRGGWREGLRLLGSIRPSRLLDNFQRQFAMSGAQRQMNSLGKRRVVAAYYEGEQWVMGMETTTHTYMVEGYGAHNSVAEHCLYVSAMIERFHGAPHLALAGLLHDAAEAYLGDIPRPIKHRGEFSFYRKAEFDIMLVVSEVFGVPFRDFDDPLVHKVDSDILPWEMVMLRDTVRVPRMPSEVEAKFLARFYELGA